MEVTGSVGVAGGVGWQNGDERGWGVTGSVGVTERGNKGGQRGVEVSAAQDDKDRTGKCAATAMGTAAVNSGARGATLVTPTTGTANSGCYSGMITVTAP